MTIRMICPNCGNIGRPKTVVKGSILIEIILWCFFLVPGIIYSLWRLTTKHSACRYCGAPNLIPLDSPRGRGLAKEFGVLREM